MRGVGLVRQGQPVVAFLLHDGEDEEQTDQLHAFMAEVSHVEWEGWEGGIIIVRSASEAHPDHPSEPLSVSPGEWIVLVDGRLESMGTQRFHEWLREPSS